MTAQRQPGSFEIYYTLQMSDAVLNASQKVTAAMSEEKLKATFIAYLAKRFPLGVITVGAVKRLSDER